MEPDIATMTIDAPRPNLLSDYRPPDYLIDTVDLDIALHPARTRVAARLAIRPNPKASNSAPAPLTLDGELLELAHIAIDAVALHPTTFTVSEGKLIIHAPPAAPFLLETVTFVSPESNTALQGLYLSRGVYCSQCEAEGFRRITYFLDRPDVLSVYTVRLEAEISAAPILLANGNLVDKGLCAGGTRHYAVWHDPHPKPCYLFAAVGADLSPVTSTFTTQSGRAVDLAIYVEHGKESRAAWAMDALKRAFRWDETRFGREYDLDVFNIVAVSDFNMGAMENKGLNIFNDRLILASPETATDTIYEAIESVVAHEYFHNWTGNRITCRDWFQLCLKEGLTVYRDQEFSADERSVTVQRITDCRQLKALQFPEDQGPLAHPVRPESYIEINNFYTPTVYEKGAELVRMIATILGPQTFRAGMDLYFDRHDGDAATIEDFIACFAEVSGRDFTQFQRWYSQAGTPELVCNFTYDSVKKQAELTVEQVLRPTPSQPRKDPLFVPLSVALVGANGEPIELRLARGETIRDGVLAVSERTNAFVFTDVPSRPVPSLLRGFSAPVNVTIDMSDSDLAFLMRNERDEFNRWQATVNFATRAVLNGIGCEQVPAAFATLAEAFAAALRDDSLDNAYKAELLKLPTQSDIAREKARDVDPAAIDVAHRRFCAAVADACLPALQDTYEALSQQANTPFSPDAASAGRRALRNAVLTLMTSRRTEQDIARADHHYWSANNMTDSAHALFLTAGIAYDGRSKVLDHYYERWHDDHLVIDTWFAAHAQSPLPGTLHELEALARHPLFKLSAPNKVRALVGTFASANPLQFNRPDGAGYDFVSAKVLEIDALNPQIAARMLGAFRSWRALEPERRALAGQALESIAKAPHLSRDCTEIVSRMLES